MRPGWVLAASLTILSSCGQATSSTSVLGTSAQFGLSSDERGVAVAVMGTLSADGTVCPGEESECDYGIVVDGPAGDGRPGDFVVGRGWYDGRRLLLASPVNRVQSPFNETASDEAISFTEDQLFDASSRVSDLVTQGVFVVQGGYGFGDRRNRVVVPIEALDAPGGAALDQLPAVVPVPFIRLLDRPLSELPAWQSAVDGTVDLITAAGRYRGGMAALGTFTIQYDSTANCLYAEFDVKRSSFVWPFGYSATESEGVVTVFDPLGASVATSGVQVQLGGGDAGSTKVIGVTGDNTCGAATLWVVNGG